MIGWMRAVDAVLRETSLFAAAGFLIGGIDDLAVDLLFVLRCVRRRGDKARTVADLPAPVSPARFAILVPAWDEAAVIGPMLTTATAALVHGDYRIFVGLYPNDRATIDAAASIAERDSRVRLVIGANDIM